MGRKALILLFAGVWLAACKSSGKAATAQPTPSPPTITVSPSSGAAGAQVNIIGKDFPPEQSVRAYLAPLNLGPYPQVYAEGMTDEGGHFALAFIMPATWPNDELIRDRQVIVHVESTNGEDVKVAARFDYLPDGATVFQPVIGLWPLEGTAGTEVTVTGRGFPPDASIDISLGPTEGNYAIPAEIYAEATTDQEGAFEAALTLPAAWPNGQAISEERLLVLVSTPDGGGARTAGFLTYAIPVEDDVGVEEEPPTPCSDCEAGAP